MTFLNDLWKKFHLPPAKETKAETVSVTKDTLDKQKAETAEAKANLETDLLLNRSTSVLQNAESVLNAFDHYETEVSESDTVRKNLKALHEVVNQPKIEVKGHASPPPPALELRFTKIKQHLGTPEVHETVRNERWQPNIHCPDCNSGNLKRLVQVSSQSIYKHRYRCLECGLVFNDDTGTPLEREIPPLNIWMQCWYLMGCTESLIYIASKLNLELNVVEYMAEQLRIIFKAQHPLTRFNDYEEWSKQSKQLRDRLKDELLKQYERLSADIATIPKDTAEFRRQQNLRRDLVSTTAPPSGGKKR